MSSRDRTAVQIERARFAAAGLAAEIRESLDRSPLAHDMSVLATELRKCALLAQGIAEEHGLAQVAPKRMTLGRRAQPKEQ